MRLTRSRTGRALREALGRPRSLPWRCTCEDEAAQGTGCGRVPPSPFSQPARCWSERERARVSTRLMSAHPCRRVVIGCGNRCLVTCKTLGVTCRHTFLPLLRGRGGAAPVQLPGRMDTNPIHLQPQSHCIPTPTPVPIPIPGDSSRPDIALFGYRPELAWLARWLTRACRVSACVCVCVCICGYDEVNVCACTLNGRLPPPPAPCLRAIHRPSPRFVPLPSREGGGELGWQDAE